MAETGVGPCYCPFGQISVPVRRLAEWVQLVFRGRSGWDILGYCEISQSLRHRPSGVTTTLRHILYPICPPNPYRGAMKGHGHKGVARYGNDRTRR